MNQTFSLRALEMHSSRMWQWSHIERSIELMKKIGLNALIFHQNDLTDQLVFPECYFSEDLMWKRNPVRMHTIYNNRHYIAKTIRALKENGLHFYIEVKELWYPDGLPELYSQVFQNHGKLCPFDPLWWEFLEAKYEELFRILPDIAGVIVSAGTRESRISITAAECACEHCRDKTPLQWYTHMIESIYRPIEQCGKRLVIRDFSYSSENQRQMIEAAGACSKDIVISLKNTPHDFYPTFPHNPSIGNCGEHTQWVEFDGWGQFFGMGVFPCGIVEDIQTRLEHCAQHGVEGVLIRTDWEVITECSILNSFNLLNLIAFGYFSQDIRTDSSNVYQAWCSHGLYTPMLSGSIHQIPAVPASPDAWIILRDFMQACWKVIEKSQYVQGHLFNEDDQYCNSIQRSFDMMVHIHGRDDWEPGASQVVEPTKENIDRIMEEKQEAVDEAARLWDLFSGEKLGLPEEFLSQCRILISLYELYVRGFAYCAKGVFTAASYQRRQNESDRLAVIQAISQLEQFAEEIDQTLKDTDYPHYIYWLLDRKRISELAADLKKTIGEDIA